MPYCCVCAVFRSSPVRVDKRHPIRESDIKFCRQYWKKDNIEAGFACRKHRLDLVDVKRARVVYDSKNIDPIIPIESSAKLSSESASSATQSPEPTYTATSIETNTLEEKFDELVASYRTQISLNFKRKRLSHVDLEKIINKTVTKTKLPKSTQDFDMYTEPTILVDKEDRDLVLYWPNFFKEEENMDLARHTSGIASLTTFHKNNDGRHKEAEVKNYDVPTVGTFHAAYWYDQGHNSSDIIKSRPHYNKDMFGCKTECEVKEYLKTLKEPTLKIAALLNAFDPQIYDLYMRRVNKLLQSQTENKLHVGKFNPFLGRAFNINQQSNVHRDRKDYAWGWTALHCFGTFKDGNFVIPYLNSCFKYEAGDLFLFRANPLHHYVENWNGKSRYSIVHFFHNDLIDDMDVVGIDGPQFFDAVEKYSQPIIKRRRLQ
ncbi:hypothetical protein AKO1_000941 [Acrasis kona]|uniref:thymine dioxygenase n=1 Tax=Acrasis kona TaxID=1008807 RepID=A0AAW2ZSB6_9EUKA